jgi:hypothetical protein
MARKPLIEGVDLDEVERSDGVIVQIGRGSVPPPEPTVADEVRAMCERMDEDEPFFEHRYSNPPPPPLRTSLGDVVRRNNERRQAGAL